MKQSTKRIMEYMPMLEQHLELIEQGKSLEGLYEDHHHLQKTFLQLIAFFENPDVYNFSMQELKDTIQDEWLELALESVMHYFYKDTYLIKSSTVSVIKEDEPYYNQTDFAKRLSEAGFKYDRNKVHVYHKRGVIPPADLKVADAIYWKENTVDAFIREQKKEKGHY